MTAAPQKYVFVMSQWLVSSHCHQLPGMLGEFDETIGCESRVLRGFNTENVLYIHIDLVLLWLRLCSLTESSKLKLRS